MPCTPDNICTSVSGEQDYTATPNLQAPSSTQHYANMGWVGYVFLRSAKLQADNILRVTSADVNLSQEITMPDVIDGRIDRSVYQAGPKIVEGTLSMPVVADVQNPDSFGGCVNSTDLNVAGSILNNLWCWTTARGSHGRLLYDDVRLDIRYANHAAFNFDFCVVNTFGMSVAQSDAVNLDINVIGRSRARQSDPTREPPISTFLSPARVLTWNDVTVNGVGGCGVFENMDLFFSNQVREWNLEINNNAERYFALNGSLFPIDVNVGKREITGSFTLMGLQDRLRLLAESNDDRFTEKNELRFSFYIGENTDYVSPAGISFASRDWVAGQALPSGNPIFYRKLTGVVFQIETMSMTNDLFETEINYLALGNDQTAYEAIDPSTSCFAFPAWA